MARIRTIKPDFWTSAQILECSPIARLMFIGMWNFADDTGRLPLSVKTIKAQVFPGEETMGPEIVRGLLMELVTNDLILPYEVDGKDYLQITGWHHQRIDKPQPPKCPPPPKDRSGNGPKTIPRTLPPDRIGKEGIGREGKDTPSGPPDDGVPGKVDLKVNNPDRPAQTSEPKTPDADLFQRARTVLGKGCGGLVAKLKEHHRGNVALARATIETASTKHDPREYIGAVLRGKPGSAEAVANLDAGLWDRGL